MDIISFTVYGEPTKPKGNNAKPIQFTISKNGCWVCVSHAVDRRGYPVINRQGKFWRMCRYIYTISKGEISEGLVIMHSCDNPGCINPDHLSVGTTQENTADRDRKNRQALGVKNGGGVKLNDDKVRAIRNDNRPLRVIARDYGISHKLVMLVKQRKNWRHVV